MKHMLQNTFLYTCINSMKTGNIIIDIFFSMLVVGLVNNLYSSRKEKYIDFIKYYYELFNDYFFGIKYKISFLCTESYSNYSLPNLRMNGSDAFKAILLDIKKEMGNGNIKHLNSLKEWLIEKKNLDVTPESYNKEIKETFYIVDQNKKFHLKNDIYDLFFSITKKDYESAKGRTTNDLKSIYTLTIESKTCNLLKIQNYIDSTIKDYHQLIDNQNNDNQFIFVYRGRDSDNNLEFTKYPFYTTCNINTIYFENKKNIMKSIDFFINNREWYKKKGKPYTLGICTYGIPGCGKTSFEKAVAKYLNRHMIIVDFSKIKSHKDADEIFFNEKINNQKIPYEKRLYVFPDIDRMTEIILKNDKEENNILSNLIQKMNEKGDQENIKLNKIIQCLNSNNRIQNIEGPKNNKYDTPLNLSKLLNILDGVPERTGQIIMMSANHPEKIDKALLRPGRIDCMIHFDKMNHANLVIIISNYYEQIIDNDLIKNLEQCAGKWTPAEIFQICSQNEDMKEALKKILNTDPDKMLHKII